MNNVYLYGKSGYLSSLSYSLDNEIDQDYIDQFQFLNDESFTFWGNRLKLENFNKFLRILDIDSKCLKGSPFSMTRDLSDAIPNIHFETPFNIEKYGHALYSNFDEDSQLRKTLKKNRVKTNIMLNDNWDFSNRFPDKWNGERLTETSAIFLNGQINKSENGLYIRNEQEYLTRHPIYSQDNISVDVNGIIYFLQPVKENLNKDYPFDVDYAYNDYRMPYTDPQDQEFLNYQIFKEGNDYLLRNEFDYLLEPTIELNDSVSLENNKILAVGEFGKVVLIDKRPDCPEERFEVIKTYTNKNLNAVTRINDSIWVAADEGIILYSTNNGRTWESQHTNTFNNLNGIHFFNRKIGVCVGDNGTILSTEDGGDTWEKIEFEDRPELIRNHTDVKIIKTSWGQYSFITTTTGILFSLFRKKKEDQWQLSTIWKMDLSPDERDDEYYYEIVKEKGFQPYNRANLNKIEISYIWEVTEDREWIKYHSLKIVGDNGNLIHSGPVRDDYITEFYARNILQYDIEDVNGNFVPLFNENNNLVDIIENVSWDNKNEIRSDIILANDFMLIITTNENYSFFTDNFEIDYFTHITRYRRLAMSQFIESYTNEDFRVIYIPLPNKTNSISLFKVNHTRDISLLEQETILLEKIITVGDINYAEIFGASLQEENLSSYNLNLLDEYACGESLRVGLTTQDLEVNTDMPFIGEERIESNRYLEELLQPSLIFMDYFVAKKLLPLNMPRLELPLSLFETNRDILFRDTNIRGLNNDLDKNYKIRSIEAKQYVGDKVTHTRGDNPLILNLSTTTDGRVELQVDVEDRETSNFLNALSIGDTVEIDLLFQDILYLLQDEVILPPNIFDLFGNNTQPFFKPNYAYPQYYIRENLTVVAVNTSDGKIEFSEWRDTGIVDIWERMISTPITSRNEFNPSYISENRVFDSKWIDLLDVQNGESVNNLTYLNGDKRRRYNGIVEEEFEHWNNQHQRSILQVERFNLYNRSLHIGDNLETYARVINNHPVIGRYYEAEQIESSFALRGKATFESLFKDVSSIIEVDGEPYHLDYGVNSYYNPGYNLLDFLAKINDVFTKDYRFVRYGETSKDSFILKDIDLTKKDQEGTENLRITGNKIITRYQEVEDLIPLTFVKLYKRRFVNANIQQEIQTVFIRDISFIYLSEDKCDKEYTITFDDKISESLKGSSLYMRSNLTLEEISLLLVQTDDILYEKPKIPTDGYAKVLSNDRNVRDNTSGIFFTDVDNEISLLVYDIEDKNMHYAPIEGWTIASDDIPKDPFNINHSDLIYENYGEPILWKEDEIFTELTTSFTNYYDTYYLVFLQDNVEARILDRNRKVDHPIFFKDEYEKAINLIGIEGDDTLKKYYSVNCDVDIDIVEYINNTYNKKIEIESYYLDFINTIPFAFITNDDLIIKPNRINEFFYDESNNILFIATDVKLFTIEVDFDSKTAKKLDVIIENFFSSGRENNPINQEYGDFQNLRLKEDYLWLTWKLNNTSKRNQRFGFINFQDLNYYELDSLCESRVIYNPYENIQTEIDPDDNEIRDFDILFKGNSWVIAWAMEYNHSSQVIFSVYLPFVNKHFLLQNIGGGVIDRNTLETLEYNFDYQEADVSPWLGYIRPTGVVSSLSYPLTINGKINSLRFNSEDDKDYLLAAFEGKEGGISVIELKNTNKTSQDVELSMQYIDYNRDGDYTLIRVIGDISPRLYRWRLGRSPIIFSFYNDEREYHLTPLLFDDRALRDEQNHIRVRGRIPSEYLSDFQEGVQVSYLHTSYIECLIRNYNDNNKLSGSDVKEIDSTENANNILTTYGIERITEYAKFSNIEEFALESFEPIANDRVILDYEENENNLFYSKRGQIFELKDKKAIEIQTQYTTSSFRTIGTLSLEKLRREFGWFLNAIVEDAVIGEMSVIEDGVSKNKLVWYKGKWICGRWLDGIWYSGEWLDGTWLQGEWNSVFVEERDNIFIPRTDIQSPKYSKWRNGNFLGGRWKNGSWFNGLFRGNTGEFGVLNKAYFENGIWYNGELGVEVFDGATDEELAEYSEYTYWLNGEWRGGTFHNGRWRNGKFNMFNFDSIWKYGFFYGGEFENGTWLDGVLSQSDIKCHFGTKSTEFYPSRWANGRWIDGHFWSYREDGLDFSRNNKFSVWENGLWERGVFHGGTMEFVHWRDGHWKNGVWIGYFDVDPQTNIWAEQEALVYQDRLITDNSYLLGLQIPDNRNMKYIESIWSGGDLNWGSVEIKDYEYYAYNFGQERDEEDCVIGGDTTPEADLPEDEVDTILPGIGSGLGVDLTRTDFYQNNIFKPSRVDIQVEDLEVVITNTFPSNIDLDSQAEAVRAEINQYISFGRYDEVERLLADEISRKSLLDETMPDGRRYRDVFWDKKVNKGGKLPNEEPLPDNARTYFDKSINNIKRNPFNSDLDPVNIGSVKYNEVYKLANFPSPPYAPQYTIMKERILWNEFFESIGYDFDGGVNNNNVFDFINNRKQNRSYYFFMQQRENISFDNPNVLLIELPTDRPYIEYKRIIMGDSFLTADEVFEIRRQAENERELEECCYPVENKTNPIDLTRSSFRNTYRNIRFYSVWENGTWDRGIWEDGVKLEGNHKGGIMKKVFWKGGDLE